MLTLTNRLLLPQDARIWKSLAWRSLKGQWTLYREIVLENGSLLQQSDQVSRKDQLEREAGKKPAGKTKGTLKIPVACQKCLILSRLWELADGVQF